MTTRVSEQVPLQVVVGCTEGIEVHSLIRAIETAYRGTEGQRVRVRVGQGVDGLTRGMLVLEST